LQRLLSAIIVGTIRALEQLRIDNTKNNPCNISKETIYCTGMQRWTVAEDG
jgi:hypothetical protein